MTPDEAHAVLRTYLGSARTRHPSVEDMFRIREAWLALDTALSGNADLPTAWARLTATAASARARKPTTQSWADAVSKGYAPAADGTDDTGRMWWHPATIDAFVQGEWKPSPAPRPAHLPPPAAGPGGGRDAWFQWARSKGVEVFPGQRRRDIQAACREKGLLP